MVDAIRSAGVPVAAMAAFLVVSPLVNPATVALLAALVSPAHALGFVGLSVVLALAVTAARWAAAPPSPFSPPTPPAA